MKTAELQNDSELVPVALTILPRDQWSFFQSVLPIGSRDRTDEHLIPRTGNPHLCDPFTAARFGCAVVDHQRASRRGVGE